MKLFTVKIYYPKGAKEEKIPASSFGIIECLYSACGFKIEKIKEEDLIIKYEEKKK